VKVDRVKFLLLFSLFAAACPAGEFKVERRPVGDKAELLTVFGDLSESGNSTSVPLVAVLRDTLGDANPENDRLRYLWILTSAQPSLVRRALAAVPFFYWRPDVGKNGGHTPAPVLDLGDASKSVWASLAGSLAQVTALDPSGALIRSSTRRYRANIADHRRVHLIEGLTILSELEHVPEASALVSEPEMLEIETRLTLAGQTLGGLVNAKNLPEAYRKQRTRTEEALGHNWELLRQRAEANGLYFDPMGGGPSPSQAMLWVAKEDAMAPRPENRPFDGKFLGIASPFGDPRLKNWSGYTSHRGFDEEGRPVDPSTPGARQVELIPLALYALDYPKVPLLVADFRAALAAKKREMVRDAITDTVSGVLGVSKFGNWPYLAGSVTWNFVRTRHGDAGDRAARLRAYSGVRQWLALDHTLDPDLRIELQKRLEMMGINPLEESVFSESGLASRQYDALLSYASDPKGLPARLDRDRRKEMETYHHPVLARLHLYPLNRKPADLAEIDRHRRMDRQLRFLETVASSTPKAEVVWNAEDVRKAVNEVSSVPVDPRATQVLERLLKETEDPEIRDLAERALKRGDALR
jgi:hypothetical protein